MNTTLSVASPGMSDQQARGASTSGLRIFSRLFAILVGGLILMGALVTSHDAGLAVPDWPTSFGENMFLYPPSKWKGIIFYEHFHRLYASLVGFLTVVLVIWTFMVEQRRWVKIFSALALLAVIVQGTLGGLTVLYQLPTATSSAHGVLGQTFFVCALIIAYSHSRELVLLGRSGLSEAQSAFMQGLFRWVLLLIGLVYVQLIIAAIMRHSGAGLAYVDFPTYAGRWLPVFNEQALEKANQLRQLYHLAPVENFHLVFHALHRIMGYLILGVVYLISWRGIRSAGCPALVKSTLLILTMIVSVQLMLGIATVASIRSPWVTSLHVLGGALLLVFSVLCAARSWVLIRPVVNL